MTALSGLAPEDLYSYWTQNVKLPGAQAGEPYPQFEDWVSQSFAGPSMPGINNLGGDYSLGDKKFNQPLLGLNPNTGRPDQLYVDYGPLTQDPLSSKALGYYFGDDPNKPTTAQAGLAGGQSYNDPRMSWDEMAVIAGLGAMTGGAFAPALAGATGVSTATAGAGIAGATGAGIRSGFDPQATLTGGVLGGAGGAIGGSVGGNTDVLSASGGTGGSTAASASGGAGMWDWLDDIGLDEYGNSSGSFQGGSGDYFDPMNGGGGSLMPPAIPPTDPTFGGTLTQTGAGQYEDLGGDLTAPGASSPWWDRFINGGKSILAGRSAAAGGSGPNGASGLSIGGAAFDSAPFLLSAYLANKQRNDINPYLDRINALSDQFAGNQPAYLKSLTDPYDMATAQQGGALRTSLGNRGVMGSSFGDMGLDNFNYMRDVGRGNLLARGINEGVGAQSQLTDQAMKAINTRNAGTNALLGAGLNASARLFSPQTDQFGLRELYRMMGGS